MQERALNSWHYNDIDNQSIRLVEPTAARTPVLGHVPSPVTENDVSNVRPKRYKAFFKHLTTAEKAAFKSQRCVVPISMRQPYHEGKKFEALLKLVDKSFASCTILIADLLQRHSLEIEYPNKTEAERAALAACMGQEWMRRNGAYIDLLTITHDITYLSEWVRQPTFHSYQSKIEELYTDDKEFKSLCEAAIAQFTSRGSQRSFNHAVTFNASLRYILEEHAVCCVLAEAGYEVEIYPSTKINEAGRISEYLGTKIGVMKNYRSPLVAIERKRN